MRNRQFLRKLKGVSDFLATDQGPQRVGDLSHEQGGGNGNVLGTPTRGRLSVSGTPTGGGSLNVSDSTVREQPEAPLTPEVQPAQEAGRQGQLQQAQGGSPAPEQQRYPRRERRRPPKLKDFDFEISGLARRNNK